MSMVTCLVRAKIAVASGTRPGAEGRAVVSLRAEVKNAAFVRSIKLRGYRRIGGQGWGKPVGSITRTLGWTRSGFNEYIQWGLVNEHVSSIIWEPGYGSSVAWSFMSGVLRDSGAGPGRILSAILGDELGEMDLAELSNGIGNALSSADDLMARFDSLEAVRDVLLAHDDDDFTVPWGHPGGPVQRVFYAAACEVVASERPDEELVRSSIATLRGRGYPEASGRAKRLETAFLRKVGQSASVLDG
ncbi:hypothetical protein J2Y89_002690 [Curtobacterium herbarum]|nr:hypothetical protein [Curtobacterium herbarum]